jgi:CheY-like chemotaxis protein/quercetin dioxygenase-like cupin family protein
MKQDRVFGKRILLVEDDASARESIKLLLSIDRHSVAEAENGRQALEAFAREPFDLVILDYAMPEMRGSELAAHLKRLAPSVPVLMVTAYLEKLVDADNRVDAVLGKPFGVVELRQAVASLAQTARPGWSGAPAADPEASPGAGGPPGILVRHEGERPRERSGCGWRDRLISREDAGLGPAAWVHAVDIQEGQLHFHKRATELYYVLDGSGAISLDGVEHGLRKGSLVQIPPGVVHGARGRMRVLVVGIPDIAEDDYFQPPAGG